MSVIIDCDVELRLRIAGHGEPHVIVTTDEGDGVSIRNNWTEQNPEYYSAPEPHHYDEWADQLELVAAELRRKGQQKNKT